MVGKIDRSRVPGLTKTPFSKDKNRGFVAEVLNVEKSPIKSGIIDSVKS
jgi:hypothetical protein